MYKYNGKEFQDELGLNMYAMDMRQYDPAIGRWVVQDPVVHHSMSPYNSFDNNPVFWADPSGADSQNESPQTTGVTLAFGVSLDSVIRSGAAIDFSGNLQSTGKGSKITLTGKNKNTVTINIGGSTSYTGSVPFDIEENILLDINSVLEGFNPDNFAVGFTIGLSANAAAALGVEGSASLSVIRYFNDTYGGYNYFYTQTELTGYDGAIKGASINIQGSIFIMSNANPGNSAEGNPLSYTKGNTTATGLSVDFKAVKGGGANMYAFRSGNWHGVGIGGNVGLGEQVNYLSAFHSVTMSSTMLNNQKPTRNRSRVDRGVNAPANAVSLMQAIYQYTKK